MTRKTKAAEVTFRSIYAEMVTAAKQAAQGCKPTPMIVTQRANPMDDRSRVVQSWHVPGGVCGFAWVKMRGTSAFARWLKANGHGRPDYPTGLSVSAYHLALEIGQSMERGEAAARAAVAVLDRYGIESRMESRMD